MPTATPELATLSLEPSSANAALVLYAALAIDARPGEATGTRRLDFDSLTEAMSAFMLAASGDFEESRDSDVDFTERIPTTPLTASAGHAEANLEWPASARFLSSTTRKTSGDNGARTTAATSSTQTERGSQHALAPHLRRLLVTTMIAALAGGSATATHPERPHSQAVAAAPGRVDAQPGTGAPSGDKVVPQPTPEFTPAQIEAFQTNFVNSMNGMSDKKKKLFLEFVKILQDKKQELHDLLIDPVIAAAQFMDESAVGTQIPHDADTGESSNNYFGMKQFGDGPYVLTRTHEDIKQPDGSWKEITINAKFIKFPSMADCVEYYLHQLAGPRYKGIHKYVGNPKAYADALRAAGYATSHTYAQTLVNIATSHQLGKLMYPEKTLGGSKACERIAGDKRLLCIAQLFDGIFYALGGNHHGDAPDAFRRFAAACTPQKLLVAAGASSPEHPGSCTTDCSSIVSIATDVLMQEARAEAGKDVSSKDTAQYFMWVVQGIYGEEEPGSEHWLRIDPKDAQQGDIAVQLDANGDGEHVEFVGAVYDGGAKIKTYGSHHTGTRTSWSDTTTTTHWRGGIWRWTGLGSTPQDRNVAPYGKH